MLGAKDFQVDAARRSVSRQYILITPNAVTGDVEGFKDVKIHRSVTFLPTLHNNEFTDFLQSNRPSSAHTDLTSIYLVLFSSCQVNHRNGWNGFRRGRYAFEIKARRHVL